MRKRRKIELTPFPYQQAELEGLLKRETEILVAVCGRGSGKTEGYLQLTQMKAADALKNKKECVIHIGTPTMTGTGDRPWRALGRIFDPRGPFAIYDPKIDNQNRIIRMQEVTIRLRPTVGRDSGVLEGDEIHLLILDEARLTPESVWGSLYPAVTRVDGQIYIATTPPDDWLECANGWIRVLWDDGIAGKKGIRAVTWRTFDSPIYGGYILPPVPTMAHIASMSDVAYKEFIAAQWGLLSQVPELYADCMKNEQARDCLYIVAKSDDPDDCKETIKKVINRRIKTLVNDVEKLVRRGRPELASAKYDGVWLPRPVSLGADIMDFVRMSVRAGRRYLMDEAGLMEPGGGSLEIWEDPVPGAKYIIGIDPAGGGGGDYSVVVVVRRPDDLPDIGDNDNRKSLEPCKLVAMLRSNSMPADKIGIRAYRLSLFYNDALVVPERTGAWGVAAIYAMRNAAAADQLGVWIWSDLDKPELISSHDQTVEQLGWKTTVASRGLMLTTLRKYIGTRMLLIPSNVVYEELLNFDWDKMIGRKNDDCVIALALAVQAMELCPEHVPEKETWQDRYERAMLANTGAGEQQWL